MTIAKVNNIEELLSNCPSNETIKKGLVKAYSIINDSKYKKIFCSISGGADSDVMLDMLWRVDKDNKIEYVFFDTGIEYQATKDHLIYLENKYNISIQRRRATVPVPLGCKEYGLPFLSKDASGKIHSLQNNKFDFANDGTKSYEELVIKYPKCKSALKWWCNTKPDFNINHMAFLKEFMIENPPTFTISPRCCEGAKKKPSKLFEKEAHIDLKCLGLRKAEGGVRATAISSCFSDNTSGDSNKTKKYDDFYPIYWFANSDKVEYETFYNVEHSKCYTDYGFLRTGCAGCPFNARFEIDLPSIEKYEPKLYKAINNIFKDAYAYTRKYRQFRDSKKREKK
jgi:3'-phosphoadenosine 5'-phosphosulfate sulfotransferase (PAPS reductase)/FAD synthetase